MEKEMKYAFIVVLLLKDARHRQKREGGLWHVIGAIPLYAEKIAIFAVYTSLIRMDLHQKILTRYQPQQVEKRWVMIIIVILIKFSRPT
jgi:hypothetical protein